MRTTLFAALAAMMLAAAPAWAQQDDEADVDVRAGETRVQVDAERERERRATQGTRAVAMRVSDLTDLEVRDMQNEEVGQIKDLVIDLESGEIRYAALSVGGVLGVGDKLFAVPWKAFRVEKQDDEWIAKINASAATFENAPGFDNDNWPTFADENWRETNDQFYTDEGITPQRRVNVPDSATEEERESGNFGRGGDTEN